MISETASSPTFRLLQTDAAGVQQQQNHARRLPVIARIGQQTDQLCSMDLAERAAHEAAFLRSEQHFSTLHRAAANDDVVVKSFRQIEQCQVRTDLALLGSNEFGKAAPIQQIRDALARRGLVPAPRAVFGERVVHRAASIRRTPCASRSETVSGRAPPSLIEILSPPGEWRSIKSVTTARQTSPYP